MLEFCHFVFIIFVVDIQFNDIEICNCCWVSNSSEMDFWCMQKLIIRCWCKIFGRCASSLVRINETKNLGVVERRAKVSQQWNLNDRLQQLAYGRMYQCFTVPSLIRAVTKGPTNLNITGKQGSTSVCRNVHAIHINCSNRTMANPGISFRSVV